MLTPWPPLVEVVKGMIVVEVEEEEDEVEEGDVEVGKEVVEEEVVVRPALSGCHLNRGGNWRHQGQQSHLQLVVLAKTLCHPGL